MNHDIIPHTDRQTDRQTDRERGADKREGEAKRHKTRVTKKETQEKRTAAHYSESRLDETGQDREGKGREGRRHKKGRTENLYSYCFGFLYFQVKLTQVFSPNSPPWRDPNSRQMRARNCGMETLPSTLSCKL